MTSPKWFEPKINFGHLLQAVAILGGIAFAYFNLKTDVALNTDHIATLTENQKEIRKDIRWLQRNVMRSRSGARSSAGGAFAPARVSPRN